MIYTYTRNFIDNKYDLNVSFLRRQFQVFPEFISIKMSSDLCLIEFSDELSVEDKDQLDSIIESSRGMDIYNPTKIQVMDTIFMSASVEGDSPTQQERFCVFLTPLFVVSVESAVESGLWDFCKFQVLSAEGLLQEDKDLILSILPE